MFGNLRMTLATTWTARRVWQNPLSAHWFFLRACVPAWRESCTRFQLQGLPFEARPIDWYAVQEIALEREYACVDFLLSPEARPQVLDLGANIGMFSLYVFSKAPRATVYAYEPGTRTFEILQRNQRLNPQLDWHAVQAAVWNTDGDVRFCNREFSTSGRVDDSGGDERVRSVSLKTILSGLGDRPVDLVKIDIEGAEQEALCRHPECLEQIGSLLVEIHPQLCDESAVIKILKRGFPHVSTISGRRSAKPVLLATRASVPNQQKAA